MSIYKEPINKNIHNQLVKRQNIISHNQRDDKDIAYLNSRTAWVRMTSSVDIYGSSEAAKNNILQAGLTNNKSKLKYGVGNQNNNAYSISNVATQEGNNLYGLRPMPGITGVQISNIGAYGSTRKAVITFSCWDPKQLDVLEALYSRPGYLVLLEFGWSSYFLHDNNLEKIINLYSVGNIGLEDIFTKSDINLLEYLTELYNKSLKYEGNYDAFLGYVYNYSFHHRADGGYDCTTELISTGEVMDSFKSNYSLGGLTDFTPASSISAPSFKGLIYPNLNKTGILSTSLTNNIPEPGINELNKINELYGKNILCGLLYEAYYLCSINNKDTLSPSITGSLNYNINRNGTVIYRSLDYTNIDFVSSGSNTTTQDTNNPFIVNNRNLYITLESLLNLINDFIILVNPNKMTPLSKITTKDREYAGHNNVDLLALFNRLQFSVDPRVCLIKNMSWVDVLRGVKTKITVAPKQDPPQFKKNVTFYKIVNECISRVINNSGLFDSTEEKVLALIYDYWVLSKMNRQVFAQQFVDHYAYIRGPIVRREISDSTPSTTTSNKTKTVQYYNFEHYSGTKKAELIRIQKSKPDSVRTFDLLFEGFNTIGGTLVNEVNKSASLNRGKSIKSHVIESKGFESKLPEFILLIQNIANTSALDPEIQTRENVVEAGKEKQEEINKTQGSLYESADFIKSILINLKEYEQKSGSNSYGIIGNIYLNLKYLYDLSNDNILIGEDPTERNDLDVLKYLKSVMNNVQGCIGNINNFDIISDPTDGIIRIVDVNYINFTKQEKPFTFNIGTKNSIVHKDGYSIESQIFPNQISMIAISAQGKAGVIGLDNSTLVAYNNGITDRLMPKKDSPNYYTSKNAITDDSRTANFTKALSIISNYVANFKNKEYKVEDTMVYKNALKDIITYFTSVFSTNNKYRAIIPTKVQIQIDGISGLIIGNIFDIDKRFIPTEYKGVKDSKIDMAYTIVSVDHSIQSNKWTTSISGYPVIVDNSFDVIPEDYKFDLIIYYDPVNNNITTKIVKSTKTFNTSNIKQVTKFFKQEGLTAPQIAGIIGNGLVESGLNPGELNPNDRGQPSYGLFQWRAGRYTALRNYASRHNIPLDSISTQLGYLKTESDYTSALKYIRQTDNAAKSSFYWGKYFERFQGYDDPNSASHQQRAGYANNVMLRYNNPKDELYFTNI